MKKFLLICAICLSLGACATQPPMDLVVTKYEVVQPPTDLLHCKLGFLPAAYKTNKNVASDYIKLYHNNSTCHNNMVSLKKFFENAKTDIK